MFKDEDNNIIYYYDTESVKESYQEIASEPMTYLESVDLYNTMLMTASLLAEDMQLEVSMPYIGIPGVVH